MPDIVPSSSDAAGQSHQDSPIEMGEGVTSLVYFEKMVPFSSANGLNSEITTSSHYLLSKRKRREKRMKCTTGKGIPYVAMRELQSEYFLSHIPMGGEGQISGYKGVLLSIL